MCGRQFVIFKSVSAFFLIFFKIDKDRDVTEAQQKPNEYDEDSEEYKNENVDDHEEDEAHDEEQMVEGVDKESGTDESILVEKWEPSKNISEHAIRIR